MGDYAQVSTDDILEHGTLSARLATDDDYLGEIDRVVDADCREDILEFVDEPRKAQRSVPNIQSVAGSLSLSLGRPPT